MNPMKNKDLMRVSPLGNKKGRKNPIRPNRSIITSNYNNRK
jgi:hypothetical protein